MTSTDGSEGAFSGTGGWMVEETPNSLNLTFLQSASIVNQYLFKDEHIPELWDLISGTSSGEYTVDRPSCFQKKELVLLPEALFAQYDLLECKCFMGLFPEIRRAWLTIDHRLFLWNYEDGSDLISYEELEHVIISVALAPPKTGVFIDEVNHVLVVATPVEVVLLGVCVLSKTRKVTGMSTAMGRPPTAPSSFLTEVSLIPTGLSVTSDHVSMLSIVGTSKGRIFMSGKDGHLYELIYQAEESWFTHRCKKVSHSKSTLSAFLPKFLKFSSEDAIIALVVDEKRNLLYSLSEHSRIDVFSLGTTGQDLRKTTSLSNIAVFSERLCPRTYLLDPKTFKIISIHILPVTESRFLHLLAVTSTGVRLYFTTSSPAALHSLSTGKSNPSAPLSFPSQSSLLSVVGTTSASATGSTSALKSITPVSLRHQDGISNVQDATVKYTIDTTGSSLELVHVRLPPSVSDNYPHLQNAKAGSIVPALGAATIGSMGTDKVHAALYSCGVCLMAHSMNEESDVLTCTTSDLRECLGLRGAPGVASISSGTSSGPGELAGSPHGYVSLGSRPMPTPTASSDIRRMLELLADLVLDGKAWAIAELWEPLRYIDRWALWHELELPNFGQSVSFGSSMLPCVPESSMALNELAHQHVMPPREFFVLTNAGLQVIVKLRPVDQLAQLLSESNGQETDALIRFFETYTREQACTMCLLLACIPFRRSASGDLVGNRTPSRLHSAMGASTLRDITYRTWTDSNLPMWATSALFRYGGEPRFSNTGSVNSAWLSPQVSRSQMDPFGRENVSDGFRDPSPMSSSVFGSLGNVIELVYSGVHNALYLYFARWLRPIWKAPCFVRRPCKSTAGHDTSSSATSSFAMVPESLLREISTELFALREFLQRNAYWSRNVPPTGLPTINIGEQVGKRLMDGRMHEEAWKREQTSLIAFQKLLNKTLEALALLSFIYDHLYANGGDVWSTFVNASSSVIGDKAVALSEEEQLLTKTTFEQLVSDSKGKEFSRLLVSWLLRRVMEDKVWSSSTSLANQSSLVPGSPSGFRSASPTMAAINGIDLISDWLRQHCPSFYSADDVLQHKGHELLQRAVRIGSNVEGESSVHDIEERDECVKGSLRVFKRVALFIPWYRLQAICRDYQRLGFYHGIIELALTCAQKSDPQNAALMYWKDHMFSTDSVGEHPYRERMNCYACILRLFTDLLFMRSSKGSMLTDKRMVMDGEDPSSLPSRSLGPGSTSPTEGERIYRSLLPYIASKCTEDELFHLVLYEWLLENERLEDLLALDTPFIEQYLIGLYRKSRLSDHDKSTLMDGSSHEMITTLGNVSELEPQNSSSNTPFKTIPIVMDVLWKYYVYHRQYGMAAHTLLELADDPLRPLSISKRIEYLSLALSNAKSVSLMTSGSGSSTAFIQGLQDKLDIAQVQLQLFQELRRRLQSGLLMTSVDTSVQTQQRALLELQRQLYDISTLYNRYARPLKLYESSLSILQCSGHQDQKLVGQLWAEIIRHELEQTLSTNASKESEEPNVSSSFVRTVGLAHPILAIRTKVKELGLRFYPSEIAFPLPMLISALERCSLDNDVPLSTRAEVDPHTFYPVDKTWVYQTLREVGVTYSTLFATYHQLVTSKSTVDWQNPRMLTHLLCVIHALLSSWLLDIREPTLANTISRGTPMTFTRIIPSISMSPSATIVHGEKENVPVRVIDEAITTYILMLEHQLSKLDIHGKTLLSDYKTLQRILREHC